MIPLPPTTVSLSLAYQASPKYFADNIPRTFWDACLPSVGPGGGGGIGGRERVEGRDEGKMGKIEMRVEMGKVEVVK